MAIKLIELKACYEQEGDSAGGEGYQDLEIQTQDAGGGIFYAIKTERWAFENIKELTDLIKDFQKRSNLPVIVARPRDPGSKNE